MNRIIRIYFVKWSNERIVKSVKVVKTVEIVKVVEIGQMVE